MQIVCYLPRQGNKAYAHRIHDAGPALTVRNDETIYSLLTDRIARSGEDSPLTENKEADGAWSKLTAGQFNDRVRAIAKGLIAFGIKKGDAVTIFSATRVEWGLLDFALAAVGAVTVPIYDTDSAAQAERILNDSNVKLAIADNQERFDRLIRCSTTARHWNAF